VAKLFGTNGVRGVANTEFTLELAAGLASSTAALMGTNVALGRDGRVTSPMLRDAVAAALVSTGCTVHDMGVLPTPALEYMTRHMGLDAGLMITASHNPPQFNGLKVVAGDGVEIPRELEPRIEQLYHRGGPPKATWDKVGRVVEEDVLDTYMNAIISHVDPKLIKDKRLSVALDTGNGVAALTAPGIASKLGCRVYTVNTEIDGGFPGRGSEPTPENLTALKSLVESTGADLAVGFDGDGDRSIVMDENGDAVWGDKSLCLIADWYMTSHPGETVVTSISTGIGIEEVAARHGGRVHWTRVGSVDISRAMVNGGHKLGGEENGGIMYGPFLEVRDGSMVMALLLHIIAEKGKPLSKLIDEQPGYFKAKTKIKCPDPQKQTVLDQLKETIDAPRVETIDGLKLVYGDKSWVLVRPSGTEPVFRVYGEAKTRERLDSLIEEHRRLVAELVKP